MSGTLNLKMYSKSIFLAYCTLNYPKYAVVWYQWTENLERGALELSYEPSKGIKFDSDFQGA